MDCEDEQLAKQLWAIGDIVRIKILRLLPIEAASCESGCNVSKIADQLNLSQPTISHHLKILRQMGIVQYTKQCRDVYYWLDSDAMHQIQKNLCQITKS